MRKPLLLAILLLTTLANNRFTYGQGGGGEKLPEAPKTSTTPVRDPKPVKPPVAVVLKPPAFGSLSVKSNVPEASVTLNNRVAGNTSSNGSFLSGTLKPGTYAVTVSKAGYHSEKKTVNISAGQTETFAFELTPITQALAVSSTPADCEVFVDDVARGRTDSTGRLRIENLVVGDHRITIRKPRFHEAVFQLLLAQEKEGDINAKLDWAVGFLTVRPNVSDAKIEVSGIGTFNGIVDNVDAQPGTYAVTATRPLYQPVNKQITVTPGEASNVSLELNPDPALRDRMVSLAQDAYSARDFTSAIEIASKLVSVDPINAQALRIMGQSYFSKNEFTAFTDYGSRAIAAGATVELELRHHHSFWGGSNMHMVRIVLTDKTISFDPQATQIKEGICPNPQFTVNLRVLAKADVSGNQKNEVYLRLTFAEPENPKKTSTLRFADTQSHFERGTKSKSAGGIIGLTYDADIMVSRPEAFRAMSAIAELINRIKTNAPTTTAARNDFPEVTLEKWTFNPDGTPAVPSAASLVETNIKASGGPVNWTSMMQRGTYSWTYVGNGNSISGTYAEYIKGREKFFHTFDNEKIGRFWAEGCDGTTAWYQAGKEKARSMSPTELASIKRELVLMTLNSFRDFAELYPTIQPKGKGRLGEREVYVLEATDPTGRLETFYFDAQTNLIVRHDSRFDNPNKKGTTISFRTIIGDFIEVGGRKIATAWTQMTPSSVITVKISDTQFDVALDETKFRMPPK
jgi:hypothetical protein